MKVIVWLGIGLVAAVMVGAAVFNLPSARAGVQSVLTPSHSPSPHEPEPAWSSGNLCSSIAYPSAGDITCVSLVSAASYPLWWNFTEVPAETVGGLVTVAVYGSADCINLNFHSFYTAIVVDLYGSDYSCPGSGSGGGDPGVNVVINSEGDTFALNQMGSFYSTNITQYGTTTFESVVMDGSFLATNVTYIGTTAGFATCPSGIVGGNPARVSWSEVSFGSFNTFGTIFVDGTNVHVAPSNYAFATYPMLPPDGLAFGAGDMYGNETTQTAPLGSCAYLGV